MLSMAGVVCVARLLTESTRIPKAEDGKRVLAARQ